ncbi:Oxygen-regulated invasion protein OrgA [Serratia fonticola]|uniref:Oxygen-regulated invasion protein OrgA n=1 Tax=Serratia fonticola TaxID=47917 RepID=A0A4U9TD16_SERFO|nr:hypothetical protein [Serratia fonticola]CAI1685135.1 Oxygen-regulated invasion protein OrgA [Serratia fonticola]VTR17325.1 Oxygen-regulated invasion protein OrgA [Serratia fonticola]
MLDKEVGGNLTHEQRIMFDPVSWIDSGQVRVPACFNQGRCRSVINEVILTTLDLATNMDSNSQNELERLFINEWFMLRKAGFLIACQRYRANLACRGRLELLPREVKQFAQLSILVSKYEQGEQLLTLECIPYLARQELLSFCNELPKWLQQRVPLLFPPILGNSEQTGNLFSADTALLRLAIQHAKRNPW